MVVLKYLVLTMAVLPIVITLLSLVRHPHWVFRMGDFPRVQIAALTLVAAAIWMAAFYGGSTAEHALLVAIALTLAWQTHKIFPYTPLSRLQSLAAKNPSRDATFSILISNVLMENDKHDQLIDTVAKHDPDVVLAVEVDDRWMAALSVLDQHYGYSVKHPQDNYYGMVLFSKLPLENPRVEFLVQDDIPSIHAQMRLRNGEVVELHCIHPRPPEPLRDQRSTPRDAELVVVGKRIEKRKDMPTIVAGDLNDVAWSATSQLFVRISGLLDPRVGRGFYNSYNAHNPLFRFPLDHVFHSAHFELVSLERLPSIGSDHFPILIRLAYDPAAPAEQRGSKKKPGDEDLAKEKLDKEQEDAATGADRPNDD